MFKNKKDSKATKDLTLLECTTSQNTTPVPNSKATHLGSPIKRIRFSRRVRVIGMSLLFEVLLLLAFREVFPEATQKLAPVYGFLDEVALPVLNWVYALALKMFHWLMESEWFKSIIDWLASLVV